MTIDSLNQYKNVSGVYCLTYKDKIIYIGQSTNIYNRIKTHLKKNRVQYTLSQIHKENNKCNRSKQLALYLFIQEHPLEIEFDVLLITTNLKEAEKYFIEKY